MKTLLVLVCVFSACLAYPMFQNVLPNGGIVPHPCDSTKTWLGVGHMSEYGSGRLNAFGLAFKKNGFTWTRALCLADSDGDGFTNGAELGDPGCTFIAGDSWTGGKPTGHPGICEPGRKCIKKAYKQKC